MGVSVTERWARLPAEADIVTRLLYRSENGDEWLLAKDGRRQLCVVHVPNAPSGGHRSKASLAAFLAGPAGPERDALLRLIATLVDEAQAGEQAS